MFKRYVVALAALLATHGLAHAQDWPNRPVRVIIPWGAGSAIDVVTRAAFEQVAQAQAGRAIVVENRPGGAGTIGTVDVLKAAPDGYTLLSTSNAQYLTPFTQPHMPFSPTGDLTGVSGLASMPNVLVVQPARFKTLKDFIAAAKAKPNGFTFGSLGIGATSYFNVKRLELSAGFQAVHVPFRGQPEVLSEVMAGRLDFAFAPEGSALPLIRSGKLRALAVSTPKRSPELPDVPTTMESGYPNSDYWLWQGIFVSSKTPMPVVRAISREINKALATTAVRTLYTRLGVDPMDTPTPEAFEAVIKKEVALDNSLAKAAGLGKATQ